MRDGIHTEVSCEGLQTHPLHGHAADGYVQGDALPVSEVIEKVSDSVWALWSDAIKGTPDQDLATQLATLMMSLHELPKDTEGGERERKSIRLPLTL